MLLEVAPFRFARESDGLPPLCSFSSPGAYSGKRKDGPKGGRVFVCTSADVTPCTTHVINWIEDHPAVAWGGRERESPHIPIALRNSTQDTEAKLVGGVSGEGCVKEAVPGAASDAFGTNSSTPEGGAEGAVQLPDIVGAGMFSEFIPLLGVILGRCVRDETLSNTKRRKEN